MYHNDIFTFWSIYVVLCTRKRLERSPLSNSLTPIRHRYGMKSPQQVPHTVPGLSTQPESRRKWKRYNCSCDTIGWVEFMAVSSSCYYFTRQNTPDWPQLMLSCLLAAYNMVLWRVVRVELKTVQCTERDLQCTSSRRHVASRVHVDCPM